MDSRELQYVIVISEKGSFSEAAKYLSVSQPALSQYVRRVEDRLGCALFLRGSQGLKLTPAGVTFVTKGRAVLSAINHPYGVSPLESIANEVFAGSLFFVAVYIINDPVTTPKYRIARVIYGLCAGLLTMVFRYYSPLEFSAVFAVLLMNALAPAFDTLCEFLIPWMNQQEQLPDNRTEQGGKQG